MLFPRLICLRNESSRRGAGGDRGSEEAPPLSAGQSAALISCYTELPNRGTGACYAFCPDSRRSACSVLIDALRVLDHFRLLAQADQVQANAGQVWLGAARRHPVPGRDPAAGDQPAIAARADQRFTCPEPPPDVALNTLSQTLVAAQSKAGASADVGSLYAAVAQVLSARTSTVEFWRTTSSMYCVLLMNHQPNAATAYLNAAQSVISNTKDTVVTLPTAASLPGLIGEARQAQAEADKKAEEAAAAQKAADAKKQAAAAAAALEQAKQECAKVPDDKKEADENCKKVKEAAAS